MLKNRFRVLENKMARELAMVQSEPTLAPPPPPAPALSVPQTFASEPARRQKEPLPGGIAALDGWISAMLTVVGSSDAMTTAETLALLIIAMARAVPTTAADEAEARLATVDACIEATPAFEAFRPIWRKCRGRQT
jgi:hypothetical protein